MNTYEGTITIKWYKNDNGGDRRCITIDCDKADLTLKKRKIKEDFMSLEKKDGKAPYSVRLELSRRP